MSGIKVMTNALFALAVVSFGTVNAACAADVDANLRADLERVAQRRIFFGHQSVGGNLLDGVSLLSAMAEVPVRIVETSTASGVKPSTLGHVLIERNEDPFRKLQSFEQAMGSQAAGPDIAFMKFCYVDINSNTDVNALFRRYRSTFDSLQKKYPSTTFVHVTAPLTVVQGGAKATLKKLLGKAPYGTLENIRREEFNALLRQTYQGRAPVFDLARVESTAPDGTAVTVEWKGSVAPAMLSAYSNDGGHLNDVGKLRAARELISVLSAIPNRSEIHKPAR